MNLCIKSYYLSFLFMHWADVWGVHKRSFTEIDYFYYWSAVFPEEHYIIRGYRSMANIFSMAKIHSRNYLPHNLNDIVEKYVALHSLELRQNLITGKLL